jgi:hypothetical protein
LFEPVPLTPVYRDFGLRVDMIGAEPGEAGVARLDEGKKVRFRIRVDRDAHVGIWSVAPDGTATQLFPSRYETDNEVKAGAPREVPGRGYDITAVVGDGVEEVWALASTKRWDWEATQEKEGYAVFRTREELAGRLRRIRGLKLTPTDAGPAAALSEDLLRYRVVGRPRPTS